MSEAAEAVGSPRSDLYEAAKRGDAKKVVRLLRGKSGDSVNESANRFSRTALWAAGSHGHSAVVDALLRAGASPDKADTAGETPLYAGAFGGHKAVVDSLLHALADPRKADRRGATPLFVAARGGHKAIVDALLQAGADVNAVNSDGWTSLFAASFHGHKDVVELLLRRGADVNKATVPDAWTPLFIARRNGHNGVAALLLRAGGRVDVASDISAFVPQQQPSSDAAEQLDQSPASKSGFRQQRPSIGGPSDTSSLSSVEESDSRSKGRSSSPGAVAAESRGHPRRSSWTQLLAPIIRTSQQQQPSPPRNAQSSQALRPPSPLLMQPAASGEDLSMLYIAACNGNKAEAETLIRSGADINCVCRGETPVFAAAARGNRETVELLVRSGADINRPNPHGHTPLYAAAHFGFLPIVENLVQSGAGVDTPTADGETPLFTAAKNGHARVVDLLLRVGADPSLPDSSGLSPLFIAASRGHTAVAEAIARAGGSMKERLQIELERRIGGEAVASLLALALAAPNRFQRPAGMPVAIIAQPTQMQATLSRGDGIGLLQAADSGDAAIVNNLLKSGTVSPNFAEPSFGWTPLYAAARKGFKPIVLALLESGADVNQCTSDGLSPLYIAASKGHTAIVHDLIQAGANVNLSNKKGWTPLFVSAFNGRKFAVAELLKHGAEVNQANVFGWTPLLAAILTEHLETAAELAQAGALVPERFVPRVEKKIGQVTFSGLLALNKQVPPSSDLEELAAAAAGIEQDVSLLPPLGPGETETEPPHVVPPGATSTAGGCREAFLAMEQMLTPHVPLFKTILEDSEFAAETVAETPALAELSETCKLSKDELLALLLWAYRVDTMGEEHQNFSVQLNEVLRRRDPSEMAVASPFLVHLLSAVEKLPKAPGSVFVSVGRDAGKSYTAGRTVYWKAFNIATTGLLTAKGGGGGDDDSFVVLRLHVANARSLAALSSSSSGPKKVLLPPNVCFVVETPLHEDPECGGSLLCVDLTEKIHG